MADEDGVIRLYSADPRGIIPLDPPQAFHVSGTLRQLVNKSPERGGFDVRFNYDFQSTMRACMQARADSTWINAKLIRAYCALHEMGFAHSVECWRNGELAGGLYGVSLGAAFFGESMFHRQRDASKVALVHLVKRLRERGFELLDCQASTPHLQTFGCIRISAREYRTRLDHAIENPATFD